MIEERAQVVRVQGERAEIVAARPSACGSCAAKSGCGTSLVASLFPHRELRFWLHNGIAAEPGDSVIVGLDERRLQRGSLLLYALPLAGLLLGAVLGDQVFGRVGGPVELGSILFGLLGLIVALSFARRWSSADVAQGDGGVRLLRVVHRPSSFALTGLAGQGAHQPEGIRKHQ